MTFTQWIKKETGYTWSELKLQGTTQSQRYRLYEGYQEYCQERSISTNFDF